MLVAAEFRLETFFFDSKKGVNFLKCTTSPRTTHTAQYQFYQIFIPISNATTSQHKDSWLGTRIRDREAESNN